MGIFLWIAFGLFAGAIAKTLIPGPDPAGTFGSLLLGMGAALAGGLASAYVTGAAWGTFDFICLVGAINMTMGVLFLYRCLAFRTAT